MRLLGREAVSTTLLPLPFHEIPTHMQETDDLYLISGHFVEKPVRTNEELSERRIAHFRHHLAAFTQFRQARGSVEHPC